MVFIEFNVPEKQKESEMKKVRYLVLQYKSMLRFHSTLSSWVSGLLLYNSENTYFIVNVCD